MYRIVTDNVLAGDYNDDGEVDQSDYDAWKADFGSTTDLGADGNGNNSVDAADYTVWRDNLSVAPPESSIGLAVPLPSVPEPAALALALALLGTIPARRR